jgi:hypothetical protein
MNWVAFAVVLPFVLLAWAIVLLVVGAFLGIGVNRIMRWITEREEMAALEREEQAREAAYRDSTRRAA